MLEKEKIDEIDVQVYKCKEDKNEIDNLYKTIYPEMCDYAKICANKYKNLNLDQEDFLYCFIPLQIERLSLLPMKKDLS